VLLRRARAAAVTASGAKGRGDTKLTDVAEEMLPFIATRGRLAEIDLQPVSAAAPESLIALTASSANRMNATPQVRWRLVN
jgi:hypothetical protein